MSQAARQRKLIQGGDKEKRSPIHHTKKNYSSNKGYSGLQFSFLCLILCVVILTVFFGMYTDSFHPIIDGIAVQLGYNQKEYAVVIDAGSTGSRVLAYEFHRGYLDDRLVLDNELFKQLKPGLSSFAHNPKDGAAQISKLLDEAKNVIPKKFWSETPLVLRATAGLRLLPDNEADLLLDAVREEFQDSGFLVEKDAVEIMDGTDEGVYSWFTINFLLNRLTGRQTVAALDLGGGSTQVTYAPRDVSQTPQYVNHMHRVKTLNKDVDVFTNSYLGLGLMAVRHSVFTYGLKPNQTNIDSVCVNSIVQNKVWKYANTEYIINGKENKDSPTENPMVDFDICLASVRRQVIPLVKPKPITLKQHQIAAFSYYFERAIETGLIDPFAGGDITVEDFLMKAKEICSIPNTDQPFMCLDLTFIAVLLQDGFGLNRQTELKLYKKVAGHEISWALGCAYSILTKNREIKLKNLKQ